MTDELRTAQAELQLLRLNFDRLAESSEVLATEIERLRVALTKINDIRNNVIGAQSIGWSSTIYPLVAALEEAGFEGDGYEQAKDRIVTWQTEIGRLRAALTEIERITWREGNSRHDLSKSLVDVRKIAKEFAALNQTVPTKSVDDSAGAGS